MNFASRKKNHCIDFSSPSISIESQDYVQKLTIDFLAKMEDTATLFAVDQNDSNLHKSILVKLEQQEEFIHKNPSVASDIMHQFLGFHLGLLDFGLKQGLDYPMARSSQSVCPLELDLTGLCQDEVIELKTASLQTLLVLIKHVKKSRIFAFWYIFLPKCTFNPCKRGILELVTYPSLHIREKTFELLAATFQSSSNHLQLANAHCKPGSFTPVCLEFAQALSR